MKFDNIDGNRKLWAVKYEEDTINKYAFLSMERY